MRSLVWIAAAACAHPAPPPSVPIANRPAIAPRPSPCVVHVRVSDAMTREPVVAATLVEEGGGAAISDENGELAIELRGSGPVHLYYIDSDIVHSFADVPCGGRTELHLRFTGAYLHHGSCEPFPDLLGVD